MKYTEKDLTSKLHELLLFINMEECMPKTGNSDNESIVRSGDEVESN